MSGIYAFFNICPYTLRWILTVGKCENKESRLSDYRTTLASIEFNFFQEIPKSLLHRKEQELIRLLKKRYDVHRNSLEQFIIGGDGERDVETNFLLEHMNKLETKGDSKHVDYKYIDVYGEVGDIRDNRDKCTFMPGQLAMITTKAGPNEKQRHVYTKFITDGQGLIELDQPTKKPISKPAWDVWQCATKTALHKPKEATLDRYINE